MYSFADITSDQHENRVTDHLPKKTLLGTVRLEEQIKLHTHQGNRKSPVNVTELGRRWIHKSVHAKRQTTRRIVSQGIEVIIAHVVIVRCSNHGDQSRNQE